MLMHPLDVMAGERARAIAAVPAAPHPIFDPTDPRCARSEGRRARARTSRAEAAKRRPR